MRVGVGSRPSLIHSEFNPNQMLTIQGTITEVSWMNPHVALKVAVKDSTGPTVWTVHGDSPATLGRNGWTRQAFAIGQRLSVCGYAGKSSADGHKMSGEQVALPSGAQLTFSTTNVKSCLSTRSPEQSDRTGNESRRHHEESCRPHGESRNADGESDRTCRESDKPGCFADQAIERARPHRIRGQAPRTRK